MSCSYEEVQKIITLHHKYLAGDQDGQAAILKGIDFYGANLANANLKGASMRCVSFRRALMWQTNLEGADLEGANFKHAMMDGIILKDANLTSAILVGVNLEHSDLRGANFTGATINGSSLIGAAYDESTVWPDGFPVESTGAVFVESDPEMKGAAVLT